MIGTWIESFQVFQRAVSNINKGYVYFITAGSTVCSQLGLNLMLNMEILRGMKLGLLYYDGSLLFKLTEYAKFFLMKFTSSIASCY